MTQSAAASRRRPDGCAGYRPQAQDYTDPRAGTLHALQGLLAGAALPVQAQSSRRVAADEDIGERSGFVLVAGGTVMHLHPGPGSGHSSPHGARRRRLPELST